MNFEQLIKLLPQESLDFISTETKVDHQVKKLSGLVIFKLILYSMLNSQKLSLRIMESFVSSAQFKQLSGNDFSTKYNSIRDRISTINPSYFEQLFSQIFTCYNTYLKEEKALVKADSTYVSITAKLVDWSMENGMNKIKKIQRKQVKFSVLLKGSLPCDVKIYTSKEFINENLALGEAVETAEHIQESIVVFDRGINSRAKFDLFTKKDILFVGRLQTRARYKIVKNNSIDLSLNQEGKIKLSEDLEVYLTGKNEKKTTKTYRIIKGCINNGKDEIFFITNHFGASAHEIAQIYKDRWEIEIFFKFLKQHLNFNHIVCRNENGIKVMLYMTMILAILILAYKKTNKIKGFKIAKLKFELELDRLITKEIVILCGGDPEKAPHLWNGT